MTFKMSGCITNVLPRESKTYQSGNKKGMPFAIDRFVIQDGQSQYDDITAFEVFSDADKHPIKDCGGVNVGDHVTVHFTVRSREYNGRYYTDIRAFKIDHDDQSVEMRQEQAPQAQTQQQAYMQFPSQGGQVAANAGQDNTDGDLPF